MSVLPIVLVSDRPAWTQQVRAICVRVAGMPEEESWSSARSRSGVITALVADLTVPFGSKRTALRSWAGLGWPCVCLLCIAPRRGAARLTAWSRGLGYKEILYGANPEEYSEELEARLRRLIEARVWITLEFARALACYDPPIIEAISVALRMIPRHASVEYWARELGLKRRQQLEGMLSSRSLPPPKKLLQWLRLARVVDYATGRERPPTRDQLARRFRYSSGRYLGQQAKELTAVPLGRVVQLGVRGLCQLMRERLR